MNQSLAYVICTYTQLLVRFVALKLHKLVDDSWTNSLGPLQTCTSFTALL